MYNLLQVKETNMAEHCSCAGSFTETLSYDTFIEQMMTFRNIARYDAQKILCITQLASSLFVRIP